MEIHLHRNYNYTFRSQAAVVSSGSHSPPTPQLPNSTRPRLQHHSHDRNHSHFRQPLSNCVCHGATRCNDTSSSSKLNIRDTTSPTPDRATSHFYPVFARSTGEASHLQRQGDCETFVFFGGGGELSWKYVRKNSIIYLSITNRFSFLFIILKLSTFSRYFQRHHLATCNGKGTMKAIVFFGGEGELA